MQEIIDGVFATLGIKLKVFIAGVIGSFISLRFFDGLTLWERWVTFIGGVAIGSYGTEPFISGMELEGKAHIFETFISLIFALVGMAVISACVKAIQAISWADVMDIIKSILGRGGR